MNVIDPGDPRIVIQTSYPSDGYPNLYLSTAGGAPNTFQWLWLQGVTQHEPWPWVTPLVEQRLDDSEATATHLFMASDHVYRSSTMNPSQWVKISPDLTGTSGSVSVLRPVAYDGTVMIYAGTSNGRVFRTDDALKIDPTWVDVTDGLDHDKITDIAVDPVDPHIVYVTRGEFDGRQLYRSTTGGGEWLSSGDGLPNVPANSIVVDPLDRSGIYVGTDVGVFSRTGEHAFSPLMRGMPLGVVVTDLEIDDEPHVLTAGTYGRGALQLELSEPPLLQDGFESGDLSAWSSASP
jgi:hypothetical protein